MGPTLVLLLLLLLHVPPLAPPCAPQCALLCIGRYNLLVATSVAEEGLDIPQCNLVIRYEAELTVKSMVQSRGRARKQDSRFVLIIERGPLEDKYRDAVRRERLMQDAVQNIFNNSHALPPQQQTAPVDPWDLEPVAVLSRYCVHTRGGGGWAIRIFRIFHFFLAFVGPVS